MLLTIFVITILCFAVAYKFYGGFQSRFYDLDPNRKTPATELQDDIDYCPAHPAVLMGHHFASIAGAGPVVGPIAAAAALGWLPTLLWIIIGCIFFGVYTTWVLWLRLFVIKVCRSAKLSVNGSVPAATSYFLLLPGSV